MTVNTVSSKISYLANGSSTVWNFGFPGIDPSFIEVFIIDGAGTITPVDPAFFSVTLNPPIDPNPTSHGGSVTYPLTGPPLAVGNQITISRELPAIQEVSLSNQSIVYPPVIEQEFDYLTLLNQRGAEEFSRAFRVGPQDPIPALVPPVVQRANKAAFFDSAGNLTPGTVPGPGVFISAAMTPVVEAATLPLARDAMGVTAAINALFTTGDLKPTHKAVADVGWIMWVDGTIGNVGSGSTIRQNIDTQALFTLYYDNYSDANCPLRTSANAATTRAAQGTASTAFNAGCRMTMPRAGGRSMAMAGTGLGLTTRALGDFTGIETINPTLPTMAAHFHVASPSVFGALLANYPFVNAFNNFQFSGTDSVISASTDTVGGSEQVNNMQPTTFINVMVKL